MRVIKFRAWHKQDKKMYPVWGMLSDIICLSTDKGTTMTTAGFSEVELMQCTGLLDKQGKDIYEGDIVRSSDGRFLSPIEDIHAFCRECGIYGDDAREVEIIGNIYEHSQLLDKSQINA